MKQPRAMRRWWRVSCDNRISLGGVAALVGIIAVCPRVVHAQNQAIGRLHITRQVLATRDGVASGATAQYLPAREGQPVFAGQGVRTLRRSQADIVFNDKSDLRVNERTDLIVEDSAALRRIRLNSGLIWIRVAKGVPTQVETPSATAVARGTRFSVEVFADGSMLLTVYEGEVAAQMNGKEVVVHPYEQVYIKKDGEIPAAPRRIPVDQLPQEMGGSYHPWWDDVFEDRGLAVINETSYGDDLRTNISGEALQQLAQAGLLGNPQEPTNPPGFLQDPLDRQQLLRIAQQNLIPDFASSGLSLSGYQQSFGSVAVGTKYTGLNTADAAFLARVNVGTVGQLIQAALANGATVTLPIGTRAYYQPDAIKGTPNFDLNLLDRTQTSDSLLGIGAAAALLTNAVMGNKWVASVPKFEVSGFGFASDPTSFVAGRARVSGLIGKTRYRFESNALNIQNDDLSKKRFAKLASVAEVEQSIAQGVTIFAGRRRFYHGPVFQNLNQTQLIADRYSSAGLNLKSGPASFEGAYIYDTNPAVSGAQKGALGSAFYRAGGGQFGLHYIHVPELTGKDGFTGSASFPVLPGRLDLYTEAGRGPDKATLQTYGAYLPGVFQATQTDVFLEFGSHTGIGRSFSVVASRDAGKYANFRAFVNFSHYNQGGKDTTAGIATLLRFGN